MSGEIGSDSVDDPVFFCAGVPVAGVQHHAYGRARARHKFESIVRNIRCVAPWARNIFGWTGLIFKLAAAESRRAKSPPAAPGRRPGRHIPARCSPQHADFKLPAVGDQPREHSLLHPGRLASTDALVWAVEAAGLDCRPPEEISVLLETPRAYMPAMVSARRDSTSPGSSRDIIQYCGGDGTAGLQPKSDLFLCYVAFRVSPPQ